MLFEEDLVLLCSSNDVLFTPLAPRMGRISKGSVEPNKERFGSCYSLLFAKQEYEGESLNFEHGENHEVIAVMIKFAAPSRAYSLGEE